MLIINRSQLTLNTNETSTLRRLYESRLHSPSTVFMIGAGFACCSLLLASLLPVTPKPGVETRFGKL